MNKQNYTFEYRDAKGGELFVDAICDGPVSEEDAREYAGKCFKELQALPDTDCAMIVMYDEQLEEVTRWVLPVKEEEAPQQEMVNEQQVSQPVSKGSLLDNGITPKHNMKAWARVGWDCSEVVSGTITSVANIDNRGLANTYVDFQAQNGNSYHCNINLLYDHRPYKVQIVDNYGPVSVWQ